MFDHFKNPPAEYRLAPFWIWNAKIDPFEIDRQVREMRTKGLGGFFIQGRFRSRIDSDGEELMHCIERACTIAERLEMHVYQYDESRAGSGMTHAIDLKTKSSAVHTQGRTRALAKVFGRHDWSLSMEEMKRIIDWQASLGMNFIAPEAFYYSIVDVPTKGMPPPQFYQATYWRYYRLFADYTARLCYVLSQGKHMAQVALIRPDEEDRTAHACFEAYCEALLREHVDFDVLDLDTLSQAKLVEDRLVVSGEEYELIILPPIDAIHYETAARLWEFAEEGGRMIGTNTPPTRDLAGEKHDDVRRLFNEILGPDSDSSNTFLLETANPREVGNALHRILRSAVKPNVSIKRNGAECSDITCVHRVIDDTEVFFLTNNYAEPREVQISIRCDGAPHMLNLECGEITALPNCTQQGNRTVLLHRFERYGSLLVAFGSEPAFAVTLPVVEEGQAITISDEWEFSTEQPNCLTLPDWTFNILPQTDHEIYDYTTSFDTSYIPEQLFLVMAEEPQFGKDDGRKVYINDNEVEVGESWIGDIGWKSVDITPLVQEGRNTIRMTVIRGGWTGDPQPVPARARIMGSFTLDDTRTSLRPERTTMRNGSWTDQGYPYFSGTGTYQQTIFIPEFARGQRVIIRALYPTDMVEFVINGAVAGVRPWAPFELDITPLVRPGANTVELRITNSMVNAVRSEPRPSGLLGGACAFIS